MLSRAETVALFGVAPANPVRQLNERRINFVLEKGRARARAPAAHVALVEHNDGESLSRQAFRNKCTADSCAENDNITGDVFL